MKQNFYFKIILIMVIILLLFSKYLHAELRTTYEDESVVKRAELIIIGHLKPDTIKCFKHINKTNEGKSSEHHATLIIDEVLKGTIEEKQIQIIINYGLTPVVEGYYENGDMMINIKGNRNNYPKGIIEIMDTLNSAWSNIPLVEDAGKNNIWFLRRIQRKNKIESEKLETLNWGINDPEDLQPIKLEKFFRTLLSPSPNKLLRELMQNEKDTEITNRIKNYFEETSYGQQRASNQSIKYSFIAEIISISKFNNSINKENSNGFFIDSNPKWILELNVINDRAKSPFQTGVRLAFVESLEKIFGVSKDKINGKYYFTYILNIDVKGKNEFENFKAIKKNNDL